MATVYIIYSQSIDRFYIGSCLDLEERMQKHIDGYFEGNYTSKTKDWTLYFSIRNLEYQEARKIENHIKRMKSRKYIENLKRYSEISDKLIKKYSGSFR